MRYVFIVNPTAGKIKGNEHILEMINNHFAGRNDYKVYVTKYQGHAKEIAELEAKTGEQMRIFAAGGEGTAFEVINAIVGYDNVALGVIPCGSANDYLKFYGEKELFMDLEDIEKGVETEVDIIKADEYYCINQCAAGMDAIVADRMKKFKRVPLVSGSMAYKLAIIKLFLGKIGMEFKIKLDNGKEFLQNCLFAVCASGPVYGGGYICAPNASPFDGELDFTIIKTISKLKVPAFLKSYEKGEQGRFDYCNMGRCKSMEIEADKEFPITLDGEVVYKKKVKFELVEKGLRFVLPKKISDKFSIKEAITT